MLRGTPTLVAIDTTRLKLQLWVFVQQFEKFKSILTTTKRGKTAKTMASMFVNSQLHKLTFQRRSALFGFSLVSVRSKDQVSISGTAIDLFHSPRL